MADSALVLVEAKRSLDSVDVHELLMHMRSFRMGLIQTFDQLRWETYDYVALLICITVSNVNVKDMVNVAN